MTSQEELSITFEPRQSELDAPGARDITFTDVAVVLQNNSDAPTGELAFSLRIDQEGKELFDGEFSPSILGEAGSLDGGANLQLSCLTLLRKALPGFGSKINFFGIKAALNWSWGIRLSRSGIATGVRIKWTPSAEDPTLIGVELF